MATARTRHAWLIGGAIGAVLMVAVAWFLLIGPLRATASSEYEQIDAARLRVPTLLSQLNALREQAQNPQEYQERLSRARRALPATPASSDFLRELHAAGTLTDVTVSDLLLDLTPETTSDPSAYALPVSVTASGSTEALLAFLDQLQTQQPRAVLIESVDLIPTGEAATLSGDVSMSLDLRIFVAREAATEAASPTEPGTTGGN